MVRFYNNIENEEKFMAIVNCVQKAVDTEYDGFDVSDPLDEMNDFISKAGVKVSFDQDNIFVQMWFYEIEDRWYEGCCSELSVETINKSFEAALSGKHFYDVAGLLDKYGWDKNLVEYVLTKNEEFIILNDKDDYRNFLNKYKVTVECPNGYYIESIDLWRPVEDVEDDVTDCMENCVMNDYCENDDGEYEDYDGNAINVEEEAARYADDWLSNLDYEEANIEYYNY